MINSKSLRALIAFSIGLVGSSAQAAEIEKPHSSASFKCWVGKAAYIGHDFNTGIIVGKANQSENMNGMLRFMVDYEYIQADPSVKGMTPISANFYKSDGEKVIAMTATSYSNNIFNFPNFISMSHLDGRFLKMEKNLSGTWNGGLSYFAPENRDNEQVMFYRPLRCTQKLS